MVMMMMMLMRSLCFYATDNDDDHDVKLLMIMIVVLREKTMTEDLPGGSSFIISSGFGSYWQFGTGKLRSGTIVIGRNSSDT